MTSYEEVAKMPPFERKTLVLVGEYAADTVHSINESFKSQLWHGSSMSLIMQVGDSNECIFSAQNTKQLS